MCIWIVLLKADLLYICCLSDGSMRYITYIEDLKCSWLVVKALERSSEEKTSIFKKKKKKTICEMSMSITASVFFFSQGHKDQFLHRTCILF